jgi:hypothetical protein
VQGLIEMPLLKKDKNIERSVSRAVSRPGGGIDRYTGKYTDDDIRAAMQRYPKLRQKLQKSIMKNKIEILSFLQSEFRRKPSVALAKYLNEFYDKERSYINRLETPAPSIPSIESILNRL